MRVARAPVVRSLGVVDRIAVLGDVHLAAPGRPLAWEGSVETLVAVLTTLTATHDAVIVNGDLYDLERGPLPWRAERELSLARSAGSALDAALRDAKVVLTAGNHDAVLCARGEAVDAVTCAGAGGLKARIEHGHRFDAWIKRWRWFTSGVTWASGRAVRWGAGRTYDWMRTVEQTLTREDGAADLGGVHARARAWMISEDAAPDVLVLGHTHTRGAWPIGERLLVNPGACERSGGVAWASLSLGSGRLALWEIENGRQICVESAARQPNGKWTTDERNDG